MEAKPQQHLINILLSTKDHHPNFTLFLGAGASVSSDIKGGMGLIKEWRETYASMYGSDKLESQPWYGKPNEYSELFERLYDQPTQRREFIENCIVHAVPSWGYVYLVNLLKLKHFNTIFTTNFDDLINEACYTFSNNLRPVVCAHDSSIKSIRLTSNRPKIIKLHGDFLFDNIKNTIRELESLEDNMRAKFRQYASEFGMIVLGYAGNDRSIMDTLNTLLHSDTAFPHGIYWCIRKGSEISEEVDNLARFPRFHLIEIDGFDEFMAELHNALGCVLQDEVANPYSALARKLDKYFTQLNDPEDTENYCEIINNDMSLLENHVKRVDAILTTLSEMHLKFEDMDKDFDDEATTKALVRLLKEVQPATTDGRDFHLFATPTLLLAKGAFYSQDYDKSLDFIKKSMANDKSVDILCIYLRAAAKSRNEKELKNAASLLISLKEIPQSELSHIINAVVDVIAAEYYSAAISILDFIDKKPVSEVHRTFLTLNKALSIRLKGDDLNVNMKTSLKAYLAKAVEAGNAWETLGFAILCDELELVSNITKSLSDAQLHNAVSMDMPIFRLLPAEDYEKLRSEALRRGLDIPEFEDLDAEAESDVDSEELEDQLTTPEVSNITINNEPNGVAIEASTDTKQALQDTQPEQKNERDGTTD